MIRRLVLFQPMTDDEARAATAWAEKLGDGSLVISYQPSPVPMRLLLFDPLNRPGRKRASSSLNVIRAPLEHPTRVLRVATATRQTIFNVVADQTDNKTSTSDIVFTAALPGCGAVAFLRRGNPFDTDASKASYCMWSARREHRGDRPPTDDVRALFWPKKKPPDRAACARRVIAYIESVLETVPAI